MTYRVNPGIFETYPSFCRGVVVASGVDNNSVENPVLKSLLSGAAEAVIADRRISLDHPRIRAWNELYQTFAIKGAKKLQPSIASLVRRIRKGTADSIPFISPLVSISNTVSLRYLMPSGLIDLDKTSRNLELGYSNGRESFEPFGESVVVSPEPGEIIYFDVVSRIAFCRAWNSKGGKATQVDATTVTTVIDVDSLLDVAPKAEVQAAIEDIGQLVEKHCGATARVYLLEKEKPYIEID